VRTRRALFKKVKEVELLWIMSDGIAEELRIEKCTINNEQSEIAKIVKRLEVVGPIEDQWGYQIGIREWFETYSDLTQLEEVKLEFKAEDTPYCIAEYITRMPKLKSLDVKFETECEFFNTLHVATMRPIPKVRFRFHKLCLLSRNS
jgi:hypothetical protein